MVQVEETPAGWSLSTISGQAYRRTHTRRPTSSSTQKDSTRSRDWRRKKDAPGRGRGGRPRSPLVSPDLRGIAVSFTYLFGLENTWAHRLMVLTLAAVIGLVLFTIGAMEHPFSGGARIGTEAFDLVLERLETSRLSDI